MTAALDQALAGCVVLVTADRRSGELAAALERRGAMTTHAPALSIIPHVDDARLVAATRRVIAEQPDVVVVTTAIGFRGWIEAADAAGLADDLVTALSSARIVARGPKARGAIHAAGLQTDWVAESETTAEVLAYLLTENLKDQRIAVQHHGNGADGLDEELTSAGASVLGLVVYRWGPPPDPDVVRTSVHAVAAGEIDALTFTSAPGAYAWLTAAETEGVLPAVVAACAAGSVITAAVGPVTARVLQDKGIEPIVPDRSRLGALVRTLVAHYEELHARAVMTRAGRLQVRRTVALLNGHVVPLSPNGLEVLRLLVDRAGSVVTRQELLAVLSGDSTDPHTAEVAIARVREALGGRTAIETVVKRGYRLTPTDPVPD